MYSTTDFLNSVRQRAALPTTTNQNNVNHTANLLILATEELHIKLLPTIMSVREEFYVTEQDVAIVAGTAKYTIPSRASGLVLRDIQLISGTQVTQLSLIDPERIESTAQGPIQGYYLQHNKIVLYPTPNSGSDTLRIRYFSRPNRLAATSDCAQISAIDTDTNIVTVSAAPSSWTTSTKVDLITSNIPYQCLAIDQSIVSITGTAITLASIPTDLAVGDWIAPQEYSPIPQVPQEFQPVLAQMTALKALQALGDSQGAAVAEKDLEIIQANAVRLVSPRNQGQAHKVINRNWRR